MDKTTTLLRDLTIFNKYAKYIPGENRRETYSEICDRYQQMLENKYPELGSHIRHHMKAVRQCQVLPSMRAMQFAGPAIEKSESRIYNCCFLPVDDYRAFSEIMFLLLGGTGVGYSVQYTHVNALPEIRKPRNSMKYLIEDSIEGWADAVKHLMKAYFGKRETKPRFDFSAIRAKGSRLVTAGGKAPGPQPLKECLVKVEGILENKEDGSKLSTLEVHDIVCHIADAVLAGGIRRAALISLFSVDDDEMTTCKSGHWWELNPQRGRANNSAVVLRHRIEKEEFENLFNKIKDSGAGEPGIYFSHNKEWGANPCCEIALRPFQFCNLTEINVSDVTDNEDLVARAQSAAFFGTLQAGFTDFHYLRPIWKRTTEKDALIGVGMTGIASGKVLGLNLSLAAEAAKDMNAGIAHTIGINPAARVTTVKPSGTTSCVLGTSSGIHAWHAPYYIRRMQCTKDESIYSYLKNNHEYLIEDYKALANSAVIEIPVKAPEGSIYRDKETAVDLLERVKRFNIEWVRAGHRTGENTNNVSATISVKDNEWVHVCKWMWENKECFNGISLLPYDGGTYEQAPFEEITEEVYNKLYSNLNGGVDFTMIKEEEDNTEQTAEIACAGGSCELTY